MEKMHHGKSSAIFFCFIKSLIALTALTPRYFGEWINVIESPLEAVRYYALIFWLMDVVAMRNLFEKEIQKAATRKSGPFAGVASSGSWKLPNAVLFCLGAVVAGAGLLILMGASLWGKYLETLHLSLLLTVMFFWPLALLSANPIDELIRVASLDTPDMSLERACLYPGLLAVVGTWMAAAAYPLDWNRPWQQWPIPSVLGACAGYQLGYAALTVLLGFRALRRDPSSTKSE